MQHLYRRGPIHTVVGAITQAADAMANAAADLVSFEPPPRVGAIDEGIATSRGASVLYAGAFGALSYVLYTGQVIVSKHHPILGTVAALFGLANLSTALFSDTVKKPAV